MERSREDVLNEVRKDWRALQDAPEQCRSDPEIVLAALTQNGLALQWAAESCRSDHEIVRTAVQQLGDGLALQWAAEACRSDREIASTALKNSFVGSAIQVVADELLEDDTFAPEVKCEYFILKVTVLSGRHTYYCAHPGWDTKDQDVLQACCARLGLEHRENMKLLHGTEEVQAGSRVLEWPGIQPVGVVTEYQLVT
mmetsp:Transcript_42238/g.76553  ORF Transcript_42238/g.76553 Transcript_42238/m.76553 type:complete len:198 (-) Transcript_42238:23-616(-)